MEDYEDDNLLDKSEVHLPIFNPFGGIGDILDKLHRSKPVDFDPERDADTEWGIIHSVFGNLFDRNRRAGVYSSNDPHPDDGWHVLYTQLATRYSPSEGGWTGHIDCCGVYDCYSFDIRYYRHTPLALRVAIAKLKLSGNEVFVRDVGVRINKNNFYVTKKAGGGMEWQTENS